MDRDAEGDVDWDVDRNALQNVHHWDWRAYDCGGDSTWELERVLLLRLKLIVHWTVSKGHIEMKMTTLGWLICKSVYCTRRSRRMLKSMAVNHFVKRKIRQGKSVVADGGFKMKTTLTGTWQVEEVDLAQSWILLNYSACKTIWPRLTVLCWTSILSLNHLIFFKTEMVLSWRHI